MFKKIFLSERLVMAVIVLNAILITWMYFPEYRHHRGLVLLDKLFIGFYLIEAAVKISVLGLGPYFRFGWNRFDFFLVAASVPALLEGFIPLPDASFLLILRLFRLARLIRYLQFVPHVEKILSGLGRALRSACLVLGILAFFNFLLAIFTCHFYGEIAPEYFEDPLTSMFSIFQMFTVEGWNEIPADIAAAVKEQGSPLSWMSSRTLIVLTRLYFALVVLLGGIFGLSLANAVFVDEMTMDNTDQIEHRVDSLREQVSSLQRDLQQIQELLVRLDEKLPGQ